MADFLIPDNFIQPRDFKMREDTVFSIPLTQFRVHDALQTNLGSAGNDDLGISSGTFGTTGPLLVSGDGAQTTVTQRARVQFQLPYSYSAGDTVKVRVQGKMAVVSDGTATVDVECYELTAAGAAGSDLCQTSAQSINSTTSGADDFTVNAAGLSPGDMLDIRITVAITDAATGSGVIANISQVALLCDIRG